MMSNLTRQPREENMNEAWNMMLLITDRCLYFRTDKGEFPLKFDSQKFITDTCNYNVVQSYFTCV